MDESQRNKWDPRGDESEKAYRGFEFYRDLPAPKRSLWRAWLDYAEWNWDAERRAAEEARAEGRSSKPLPGFFGNWSSAYDWVERAKAWDTHKARLRQMKREAEHLEALDDHLERQLEFGKEALRCAREMMKTVRERVEKLNESDLDDPEVLAKLIRANIQLFRAALEAEAEALSVDEILVILDEQGKTIS